MKTYDVIVNGVHTTIQLSDEEAERRGLAQEEPAVEVKAVKAPANKAGRTPANK